MSDPICLSISHIFVLPCTEVITSLLDMKFEYLKNIRQPIKYSSVSEKKNGTKPSNTKEISSNRNSTHLRQ